MTMMPGLERAVSVSVTVSFLLHVALIAAIPAVIAYNYYLGATRNLIIEMEDFSEEILDIVTSDKEE